ncbi:MAG: DNA repair protein RadC [Paludibacteraceae bacterium]|nr:DNA repair protein RadC [Paludibacteraceae bacterium]
MSIDSVSIKDWAVEDRPREKMIHTGLSSMTDAELLAILIGSGTIGDSAVSLAQKLLRVADNDLVQLGRLGVKDLSAAVKGIGPAKATTIVAAMELARRRRSEAVQPGDTIRSSAQLARVFVPMLSDLPYEEFWVVLLNRANRMVAKYRISMGGVNNSVVDPRIVFKYALQHLASGLVFCHNHPSGNLSPSKQDLSLTKRLVSGAKLFDLQVLDHIIVGDGSYFSFADDGLLKEG